MCIRDSHYLAGPYSIADMACIGWARLWHRQGQDISEFPHLERWLDRMLVRPAVQRAIHIRVEEASAVSMQDPAVRSVLFSQRAR